MRFYAIDDVLTKLLEGKEKQNNAHFAQNELHNLNQDAMKGGKYLPKSCKDLLGLRAGHVHSGQNLIACANYAKVLK